MGLAGGSSHIPGLIKRYKEEVQDKQEVWMKTFTKNNKKTAEGTNAIDRTMGKNRRLQWGQTRKLGAEVRTGARGWGRGGGREAEHDCRWLHQRAHRWRDGENKPHNQAWRQPREKCPGRHLTTVKLGKPSELRVPVCANANDSTVHILDTPVYFCRLSISLTYMQMNYSENMTLMRNKMRSFLFTWYSYVDLLCGVWVRSCCIWCSDPTSCWQLFSLRAPVVNFAVLLLILRWQQFEQLTRLE